MSQTPDQDKYLSRQARVVSVVIAATMILWLGAQWLGGALGLPERYVFLFDLLAMAGFFWALVVTWQSGVNDAKANEAAQNAL